MVFAFCSKELARTTIKTMQEQTSAMISGELAVRINSPGSGFAKDDISVIFDGKSFPKTVVLPKVNHYDELRWVNAFSLLL